MSIMELIEKSAPAREEVDRFYMFLWLHDNNARGFWAIDWIDSLGWNYL